MRYGHQAWNGHQGWNGHLARLNSRRAVPTLARSLKMRVRRWVVRYGADYPNAGYDPENEGKSAPEAPLALLNSKF
ncbi:hypothetical protein [Moorena sp. SIO3I6]|uniref:hypothetical protein n=1 Tax=Moorena sp. SIO3I6 TaxID=2607831 RepID=UPI0025DFE761|nr:hypothetical protein [Moorena sp. SIO3I6]